MAAFMDELVIDPISGEQITPRHSLLVPLIRDVNDVGEYLKSVGSIVGPKNIRSAYKVDGYIKVYLRFLKHVEDVISGGVVLQGRSMNVKYGTPPATEILLMNVDTEIPNMVLTSALSKYGTVVAKVTTDRVSVQDPDFSHIESNRRRAFMQITSHNPLPTSVVVTHCKKEYRVDICVGDQAVSDIEPSLFYATETASEASPPASNGEFPAKRARVVEEPNSSEKTRIMNGYRGRGRGRTPQRGRKILRSSLPPPQAVSTIEKTKSAGMKSRICRIAMLNGPSDLQKSSASSDETSDRDVETKPNVSTSSILNKDDTGNQQSHASIEHPIELESMDEKTNSSGASKYGEALQYPFSIPTLQKFLKDVKNHRNPREVALSMLKENNTPGAIEDLCNQLLSYYECCGDNCVKLRITRLVQIFSDEKSGVSISND